MQNDVEFGTIWKCENMTFCFFKRAYYDQRVEEKRIYYPSPHLALIVGPGYGMLVQSQDGSKLEDKEVKELDGRGQISEQKANKKLAEISDEVLRELTGE